MVRPVFAKCATFDGTDEDYDRAVHAVAALLDLHSGREHEWVINARNSGVCLDDLARAVQYRMVTAPAPRARFSPR